MAHERLKDAAMAAKAANLPAGQPDERTVLAALGITEGDENDAPTGPRTPATAPPRETEQQRLARYEAEGEPLPDLCGDFGHPDVGFFKGTPENCAPGSQPPGQGVPVARTRRSGPDREQHDR